MKKIYYLFLIMMAGVCCASCNNEWEDEQFLQLVSLKAEPNSDGVTPVYVRYKPGGVVSYNLPLLLSGSTMNTHNCVVHIAVDEDTLKTLNKERYGEMDKIYYEMLTPEYRSFPETVEIPAGECSALLPISFTLGGQNGENPLDLSDKYILPLTIVDDLSYNYQANPRKHYRKALLNVIPFNDYSGTYASTQCKITDQDKGTFTVTERKSYVYDDNTIFIYAGMRVVDYLDRKFYKVFIEFTNEKIDLQKKKLRLWSDNDDKVSGNAFELGSNQSYYTIEEQYDVTKPYLKHIYYTLYIDYKFVDYHTSPGQRLPYTVQGTLSMQRDLNTLIPDEDQQIEWD